MRDCPKLPRDWKNQEFKKVYQGAPTSAERTAVIDHERLAFPGVELSRWLGDLGAWHVECRTTRRMAHTGLEGLVRFGEVFTFSAVGFGTPAEVTEALVQYIGDCGCLEIET